MQVKEIDSIERKIAIGCVVSDQFLRDIRTIYNPDYLKSDMIKKVVDWCVNYYSFYESAPKETIVDIYHSETENYEEVSKENLETLLESVNAEYVETGARFNADYYLKQTQKYFKKSALSMLRDDIEIEIDNGDYDEAEERISNFNRVEIPSSDGYNPITDEDKIFDAFQFDDERLLYLPGDLGKAYNHHFVRDGFVSFLGPMKRGKTMTLVDLAYRAYRQRNNVAFFSLGDMTERQMTRRIHMRMCQKSFLPEYCNKNLIPCLDCIHNQNDTCQLEERVCDRGINEKGVIDADYKACTVCQIENKSSFLPAVSYVIKEPVEPLTWEEGVRRGRKVSKRTRGRDWKQVVLPSNALTIDGIKHQTKLWETFDNFLPDIIFIDYADNMAEEPGTKGDFRHAVNRTWKGLRGLATELNCLIITATQSDAGGLTAETLGQNNFSEDVRKLAEVTLMISLNQTPIEKEQKIMRWGTLAARESYFNVMNTVTLLQSMETAQPVLDSFFTPHAKDEE